MRWSRFLLNCHMFPLCFLEICFLLSIYSDQKIYQLAMARQWWPHLSKPTCDPLLDNLIRVKGDAPKKLILMTMLLHPQKNQRGRRRPNQNGSQRLPPKKNLPQRSQRLLQMWKPQMSQLPQMRKNRYLVVLAVGLPRKAVLLASVQASKAVEQGSKSQAIRSIKCWPLWQGKPCTCIMRTVP